MSHLMVTSLGSFYLQGQVSIRETTVPTRGRQGPKGVPDEFRKLNNRLNGHSFFVFLRSSSPLRLLLVLLEDDPILTQLRNLKESV